MSSQPGGLYSKLFVHHSRLAVVDEVEIDWKFIIFCRMQKQQILS